MSSAANVLTRSPRIWHVNKRDFLSLYCLVSDPQLRKRCCGADFNNVLDPLPCCFWKGTLKVDFLDIYLTTFSELVISEIKNLLGSSFVSKFPRFDLDFQNAAKNWERVFCFWDNSILIGIVKFSRLRTRYWSSPENVLRNSPKIWHVNKRDFL